VPGQSNYDRKEASSAPINESSYMKTNIRKIGVALLAMGLCLASTAAFAQTTTTVTTSKGAFTEYVPKSETVVVRTETSSAPLRYTVTKQTTIVDEAGAPVAIERISPGSQLAIDYSGTGERLVASRIVVHKPATVTAPVTTAPVITAPVTTAPVTTAPVTTAPGVTKQQTTTTTTTTAPLTRDEKRAVKEARKEHKEEVKKDIERKEEALEKAKDKLDDDDDD
jgi:hypothetical protein